MNNTDIETTPISLDIPQVPDISDPGYIHTFTHNQLLDMDLPGTPAIIPGLLLTGVTILAGAPKIGKSFLVLQIGYHVATGKSMWDRPVLTGHVLYLALEDTERRLQQRSYDMFGPDGTNNLHFATAAKKVNSGLLDQLSYFLNQYPDTGLIIIDTMQASRDGTPKGNLYAEDCAFMETIQGFSKKYKVSILLVHHTRKMPDQTDSFNMVSGSNGNMGGADTTIVMSKENRTDRKATLEITGRDIPDQRLLLARAPDSPCWELSEQESDEWDQPDDPILRKVSQLVTEDAPELACSATELKDKLGVELPPNQLSRHLSIHAGLLESRYHITLTKQTRHQGRVLCLTYHPEK